MFKPIAIAVLLLTILAACSIATAPPVPTAAPTPATLANTAVPASTAPPAASATPAATPAPDRPALWVLDGAQERLVAVDPQTGQVLNQAYRGFDEGLVSADEHWRYALHRSLGDNRWRVTLSVLDLTRSKSLQEILLSDSVPLSTSSSHEVTPLRLLLSADQKRVYALLAEWRSEQWQTRLYGVDLRTRALTQTLNVLPSTAASEAPPTQALLSTDGRRLFVAQNVQRQAPAKRNDPATWFTRLAVLDLASGAVERSLDVPGDVQAHGFWVDALLAPNGSMLYLMQTIVRNSDASGYRFLAFETSKGELTLNRLVDPAPRAEEYSFYRARLTPDGRYLVSVSGMNEVRVVDVQTGVVTQRIVLERTAKPATSFDAVHVLLAPDQPLVYIVHAQTKEIFVFDTAQRKVVRHAVLSDSKPTSANPLGDWLASLSGWFVGTAYAKM